MGAPTEQGRSGGKGGGKGGRHGGKGAEKGGVPLGVGGRGGRGKGGQPPPQHHLQQAQRQKSGEPFAEPITFAGRSDDFVIAKDTFIPCAVYEAFHEPSELVEGAIVRGLRVSNEASGKSSKWRATRVDGIDAPPLDARRGARSRGGAPSSGAGEPFDELVTYAGRAEQFVSARNTFVPAGLFAKWRPVFEGDRLVGKRVLNSGGSSKYRATCVTAVIRAEGPALSLNDAWLERGRALLARAHAGGPWVVGHATSDSPTPTGGDEAAVRAAHATESPSEASSTQAASAAPSRNRPKAPREAQAVPVALQRLLSAERSQATGAASPSGTEAQYLY